MASIDLNSDLGESFGIWKLGDDAAMLDVVTSANIACGFHAGDPSTLRQVCERAAERKVAIGAQVSYPDLVGFGRRRMEMAPDELCDAVLYQLGALDAFAQVAGSEVSYVKPHGALYHATVDDLACAEAVVKAAIEYDDSLVVLGLPGSELLAAAERLDIASATEAFADRAYQPNGRLVPRTEPGSVLSDPTAIAQRCVRLATVGRIDAIDGSTIEIDAESVCVHGDTAGAVEIAHAVRAALETEGVEIARFTR